MKSQIDDTTTCFVEDAFVWDAHAGFESRPDARLEQLKIWKDAHVSYLSVNVGYDVRSPKNTIDTLASFRRQIKRLDQQYLLVEHIDDIDRAANSNRLGITFDIEGMESLDGNLDMVSLFYDLGVRQMLFAYNLNNRAGGGCHDEDIGLTQFGREIIEEMNRVGMIVDCSHTGFKTTMEAMELSSKPVIFSHSNPYQLVNHRRNILDDKIMMCASTGGVVGINGIDMFLGGSIAPNTFVDHLAYVSDLVGVEHVGIGLDYADQIESQEIDAVFEENKSFWPVEDYRKPISKFMSPHALPAVVDLLLRRGFTNSELHGILGFNFRRVAKDVWK